MPVDLDRAAAAGKRKTRPRLKLSKHDLKLISNTEEVLVPIRLEIEVEHWKLRDTFTWNLKEPVVTPEQFAIHLCEDLILPIQHFSGPIVSAIKEQLEEYKLHENFEGHLASRTSLPEEEETIGDDMKMMEGTSHLPLDHKEPMADPQQQQKEEAWWAEWRERIMTIDETDQKPNTTDFLRDVKRPKLDRPSTPRLTATQSSIRSRLMDNNDQDFRPEPAESISLSTDLRDDELRIPINLDIISGNIHLTDRFEWEISELNNSPEEFVEVYANDLGLSGEFKTAIAHSIREQIETYVKSLALVEHINGYPVPNDELRYAFLQRVADPIRTGQVDDFTPFLNLLNAEELDRQEKEHDREARRKRRQTRSRRGITLPDRESQRTVRSIVPIQGLKMVIPYQNENEDLIVPIQPVAEPFAIEESAVEIPEPSEHPPKKHIPVTKEVQIPDSQLGTPNKATGSRVSRRLRGATADVASTGTPPKTVESNPPVDKDDAPTPSNAGTPAPCPSNKKTNNKPDPSTTNIKPSKKPPPSGPRTRGGVDWEALGLHDPMVDGVWHCSNCGCPDSIAVGRRKGLGGKDTLCGECGRYMHRYKRNRPTLYNTSADYHTSLKLEADKAKQAIADQEIVRKDKNKTENQNLPGSLNSKKRKKEGRSSLLPKPELMRRSEDRAASVASSAKSAASRESSPEPSVRSANNGASEKPLSKKRSRIHGTSEAPPPATRAQKGISKTMIIDSPEPGNSPDSNSPTNARSQSTSTSQPTKPARVSSRRSSTKKGSEKNEDGPDRPPGSKSPPAVGTRQESQKRKEPRSKDPSVKTKNGSKSPEEDQVKSQPPPGSRSGSFSGSVGGGKDPRNVQRRSMTNGRVPPPIPSIPKFDPPAWMTAALSGINKVYPSDRVELIPKPRRLDPGQPLVVAASDWRLKCTDCPGKLYTVGPGESFTNFDVHLKNRQHRQKVEQRVADATKKAQQQISPTGSSHSQPEISPTGTTNQQPSQSSSSTTFNAHQPQVSPTDGSQQLQISPSDGSQQLHSHAGSQISPVENTHAGSHISPVENNSQLNGHNSRGPSEASPIVFDSQYQPMVSMNSHLEGIPFENPGQSDGNGPTSSLPPITTTLAAAESTGQEEDSVPPVDSLGVDQELVEETSEGSANPPPAPSSLDGVAIQENNDSVGPSQSSKDGEEEEETGQSPIPAPGTAELLPDSQQSHPLPLPPISDQLPPSAAVGLPGLGAIRPELPARPMIGPDGPGPFSSSAYPSSGPTHSPSPGLPAIRRPSMTLAGAPHHLGFPARPTPPPGLNNPPLLHHPAHLHYNRNNPSLIHGPIGGGNGIGNLPGLSSSSSVSSTIVPSSTAAATGPAVASHPVPIRHPPPPPPPHTLVHPLPKKPTFD
ncbi:uncharacterized protein PGTG_00372 [Puccinia graminis f. sp. tritici CRL 75-36-700-3]|uniref:SWI/SNF chromatin-remodeling complex subunit n=1 Tax=Puccinia graminis f. sp. tritici (strain CRL 75-36-700-3 / race SCCL) TaxID=418459 RepID=E3JQV4_PUCGT|nr:uncharacterized protein PGTG_00372 [Puccinia graminis f. sp. tritici CRL 75-36-700-3]EFP74416.2 hypothetical protein PGTG_00372 [Puccinia graminis f. sp. tritici CRL 75-36-700-3]